MTVYHLYGPAAALPTVIDFEADRFQHLDYTEEQFKTEAGAILGEYAKSASSPEQKLDEKIAETAYTKHTYRHTTIGYLDDVKAMPSGFAYSREFFRRYYTPDNATVIVVGDFDKKETLAHLTKAYGGWKGKLDAGDDPRRAAADRRAHGPRRLEDADAAAPVAGLAHAGRHRPHGERGAGRARGLPLRPDEHAVQRPRARPAARRRPRRQLGAHARSLASSASSPA